MPLESLLRHNDTSRGDLARQIQRIIALGFTAVRIPFSFNDIARSDYLSGFVRQCNATDENDFRMQLLPPDFPAYQLSAVSLLEPLGIVRNSTVVPSCNWYLKGVTGLQLFFDIVGVFLDNGLDVILQNIDTSLVKTNANAWITNWVELSTYFANMPATSGTVFISPLQLKEAGEFQWASQNGVPGLTELYKTVLSAIDVVLPNVVYVIEGVQGNDFMSASTFLQQTISSARNGRIVPLADTIDAVANFSGQFGYLTDEGICLTAGRCQTYTLAAVVQTVSSAYDVFLGNSTWVAVLNDPTDPSWESIMNLTSIGLRPWFAARSAYNPLPGQPVRAVVEQQSATFGEYSCNATVKFLETGSDTYPANSVVSVTVANLKDVSVEPPYDIQVNSSNIQSALQVFGGLQLRSALGSYTSSLQEYHNILWPLGQNSISQVSIVQLSGPLVSNVTVSVAGLPCFTVV